MSRGEVAARARVSEWTVDRHRRRGTLPASRIGGTGRWRYHIEDVDRWISGGRLRVIDGGAR